MILLPDQPVLDGFPPAVQPRAPRLPRDPAAAPHADGGEPLKCCFIGHLACTATVRDDGTTSVVEVLLHQQIGRAHV